MSHDAAYEECVGQIPPQGGPHDEGTPTTEGSVQMLGLPTSGGCDGRSGVAGDVDLRLRRPEHSSTISCNYTYYGPVSGGKEEARAKGGNTVEGTFLHTFPIEQALASAPPAIHVQAISNYHAAQQAITKGFSTTVFKKEVTAWHQWQHFCIWLQISPDLKDI